MSKRLEELKNELLKLSNAVNAFKSESVQVIIVDWLLTQLKPVSQKMPKSLNKAIVPATNNELNSQPAPENTTLKQRGATYLLRDLLVGEYFDTGRTLAEIVQHLNAVSETTIFKSHQISSILLKLVNQEKLSRSEGKYMKDFRYSKI